MINNTLNIRITPEFDKLPIFNPDARTMNYTGIGSRKTPPDVQVLMRRVAAYLCHLGYTLRSGGAEGADKAFELGVTNPTKKQIFYAKHATPTTMAIAKEIHPAPNRLPGFALKLMARNTNQLFGVNLDTPSDFVVAWTPDGIEASAERTQLTGGTGQAIDMASRKGIPVVNMAKPGWESRLRQIVDNHNDRMALATKINDNALEFKV